MAKEPEAPKVRDLIHTGIHTEFGELLDDPNFVGGQDNVDMVWTPGFSEARIARDTALNEVAAGRMRYQDAPTLNGNVRLVRRASASGAPDQLKMMQSSNKGYRLLTKADIGPGKLVTDFPPGATVLADGSIAKGDCVYMWCDAQTAARNSHKKQQLTNSRLNAAAERANQAGVEYSSTLGQALEGSPASRVKVS